MMLAKPAVIAQTKLLLIIKLSGMQLEGRQPHASLHFELNCVETLKHLAPVLSMTRDKPKDFCTLPGPAVSVGSVGQSGAAGC